MSHKIGPTGDRYDDAVPLYCTTGSDYVWHRTRRKFIRWSTLSTLAAGASYTWPADEVGVPPIWWQMTHNVGMNLGDGVLPGPPATNGITNGEAWAGASGATQPTSWTKVGTPTFTLTGGVLYVIHGGTGDAGMSQSVTTTASTKYLVYVKISAVVGSAEIKVGTLTWPVSGTGVAAIPITAAGAATVVQVLTKTAGSQVWVDYVRAIPAADAIGGGQTKGPDSGKLMDDDTPPVDPPVFSASYAQFPDTLTGVLSWNIHVDGVDHDGVDTVMGMTRADAVTHIVHALNAIGGFMASANTAAMTIDAIPDPGVALSAFAIAFEEQDAPAKPAKKAKPKPVVDPELEAQAAKET